MHLFLRSPRTESTVSVLALFERDPTGVAIFLIYLIPFLFEIIILLNVIFLLHRLVFHLVKVLTDV